MNKILISMFLLCCLWTASFSAETYFPLKEGLKWVYESDMKTGRAGVINQISEKKVIDGKTCWKLISDNGQVIGMDGYFFIDGNDVYRFEENEKPSDAVKFSQVSYKGGEKWSFTVDNETVNASVSDKAEDIETISKKYKNCYRVTYTSGDQQLVQIFAPNVGLVKVLVVMQGLELVLLNLKKFENTTPIVNNFLVEKSSGWVNYSQNLPVRIVSLDGRTIKVVKLSEFTTNYKEVIKGLSKGTYFKVATVKGVPLVAKFQVR